MSLVSKRAATQLGEGSRVGSSGGSGTGGAWGRTSGWGGRGAGGCSAGGGAGGGMFSCGCGGMGVGATGMGAGGGSRRSSGGVKPRFGNPEASLVRLAAPSARRGVAEAVLVVSLDQSLCGAGAAWVRASWKRRLSLVTSAGTCPIRSGIARSMNAANDTAPSTKATQGVQRHASTWGSPFSRIQAKGNPVARA